MEQKSIGVIGTGEMGLPMARNLLKAGHRVIAFNRSKESLKEIEKDGAEIAKSPKAVAQSSEIVIIMVRTTEQTVSVMLGKDGVLDGVTPESIVIIMSTIDPRVAQELSEEANKREVKVLDAPVSGAKERAEAGTLTVMVGGDQEVFEECRPILEVVGKNIFYLGDSGMGESAKLINNLLLLVHMNIAFEAMNLAQATGIKIDVLQELIKVSTGNSWIIENWDLVKSWKDNYKEGGTLDLMYKDINLTMKLGEDLKVPLHLSSLAKQLGRY